MKLLLPILLSAPLLLAACTEHRSITLEPAVTDESQEGPSSVDTCGATGYANLIGQTNPKITVAEGTPYRSYRKGDPVTSDFALKRLNFEYDAKGKLLAVSCG